MHFREIRAKTILVKSRLPDTDYVVNPYTGCEFGCLYCYASFMGKFVNEPIENWGNYVYVKTNAVAVFERELSLLRERNSSIFISSVTDPYQGAESRYRLTRGILSAIARSRYPGPVSIQTKSSLVLRDMDVIKRIPDAEVGMTVTTTDDRLSRFLEVRATAASMRVQALKRLNEEGIRTYAFVGPLLPHFRYEPELLDDVFAKIAGAGVAEVYVEHINLSGYIRKRMFDYLSGNPELQRAYSEATTEAHRKALDRIVKEKLDKYGLRIRLSGVIYHPEWH